VREEDWGFVAFGNLSATCYACYGGEETSCTLIGCNYRCQLGLARGNARLLRIFGGVTNFG
jgi:hypothetical protein